MAKRKEHGIIRVQVTEEDIAKATRSNSMRCVVAQAIARTIPTASRIDVDVQTIRWTDDGDRHVYLTPYSVQGYVVAFDAGDEITPFGFGLDSRRRVQVKKRRDTPAGAEIRNASSRAATARKQRDRTAELVLKDQATPTALEQADQKVAEREAELVGVRAAYEGQVTQTRIGEGRSSAPPRVHKKSERAYGHRVLRINQAKPQER